MLLYVILYSWPKRGGVGGLNWKGVWTVEVGKRYSCVTLAKGAVSAGADKVGIFSLVGGLCRRRRLSIACECRDGGGVGLRREAAHPLCSITLLSLSLMSLVGRKIAFSRWVMGGPWRQLQIMLFLLIQYKARFTMPTTWVRQILPKPNRLSLSIKLNLIIYHFNVNRAWVLVNQVHITTNPNSAWDDQSHCNLGGLMAFLSLVMLL